MLRQFNNQKAQNTAEYALLIALVIAGVIAMQTYAQRALQSRVKDASSFLTNQTSNIGTSQQYEPYYMQSNYERTTSSEEAQRLDPTTTAADSAINTVRTGSQQTTYNATTGF